MIEKLISAILIGLTQIAFAQSQTSDDEYTRYELLDPSSQSFRILYEVTATKAGTLYYYNGLRKGSDHKVDSVKEHPSGRRQENPESAAKICQ